MMIKCEDAAAAPHFVERLKLRLLFGDFE